jgi:HPt (histidine-containing phosphotransfer) domain-containing protein
MEIMKEQKIVYLTRRKTEVEQLKESLDKNSFELAQIIGHRLKGHGETFGFPQISAIGIKMEEAAIERNTGMLREAVMSLDESIEESFKKISQM